MYCAGHLIQAAIALRRGAGDGRLLAVAVRLADHLVKEFAGQTRASTATRSSRPPWPSSTARPAPPPTSTWPASSSTSAATAWPGDSGMGRRYLQDHLPVRASDTEVGHVVRALYLEAGVTDVATETGDRALLDSSVRRWDDMVAAKTYLTGGNGSRHDDEGFGDRFELPPDRAYNETCAAIASFQWSWRLLLATGDAKYADHMERVLYNGFAAAIATGGERFFYVNPLQRREDHYEKDDPGRRRVWFKCACCPPNIMRLLASLQHYLATESGDTLYIHQYTAVPAVRRGPRARGHHRLPVGRRGHAAGARRAAGRARAGPAGPGLERQPRISVNNDPERSGLHLATYLRFAAPGGRATWSRCAWT